MLTRWYILLYSPLKIGEKYAKKLFIKIWVVLFGAFGKDQYSHRNILDSDSLQNISLKIQNHFMKSFGYLTSFFETKLESGETKFSVFHLD